MVSWCKFVVLTTHFRPCRVRFCHFQSPSKIGCPKFWPHGCQNLSKWVKSSIFHTIGAEVMIFVPTTLFSTPMCSIIVRTIVSTTSFLPSKATFLVFSNTFKNVFTQILTPGVLKLLKMEKSLNECVWKYKKLASLGRNRVIFWDNTEFYPFWTILGQFWHLGAKNWENQYLDVSESTKNELIGLENVAVRTKMITLASIVWQILDLTHFDQFWVNFATPGVKNWRNQF